MRDLTLNTAQNVTSQEQAIILANTNLENTKSTYGQSLKNRQDSASQTAESNISVATYALDVIDTILTDDLLESSLGLKDSASLTLSKELYADAIELRDEANDFFANYQN